MKGITYKMKNLKSKVLILLAFVLMITAAPVLGVQAASGTMTVSVSKTNVNVGDNFTVTVSTLQAQCLFIPVDIEIRFFFCILRRIRRVIPDS